MTCENTWQAAAVTVAKRATVPPRQPDGQHYQVVEDGQVVAALMAERGQDSRAAVAAAAQAASAAAAAAWQAR
jgi:hypothetical protein